MSATANKCEACGGSGNGDAVPGLFNLLGPHYATCATCNGTGLAPSPAGAEVARDTRCAECRHLALAHPDDCGCVIDGCDCREYVQPIRQSSPPPAEKVRRGPPTIEEIERLVNEWTRSGMTGHPYQAWVERELLAARAAIAAREAECRVKARALDALVAERDRLQTAVNNLLHRKLGVNEERVVLKVREADLDALLALSPLPSEREGA